MTRTRSPAAAGRSPFAFGPISSTSPQISWPSTAPGEIRRSPLKNVRTSVPQIPQAVTRSRMPSSGQTASSTSPTVISPGPCQIAARIGQQPRKSGLVHFTVWIVQGCGAPRTGAAGTAATVRRGTLPDRSVTRLGGGFRTGRPVPLESMRRLIVVLPLLELAASGGGPSAAAADGPTVTVKSQRSALVARSHAVVADGQRRGHPEAAQRGAARAAGSSAQRPRAALGRPGGCPVRADADSPP